MNEPKREEHGGLVDEMGDQGGMTVKPKHAKAKSVLDRQSRISELVEPLVVEGHKKLSTQRIPLIALYTAWILFVGIVSAFILNQHGEADFFACFFTTMDGLTGSGLSIGHKVSAFSSTGKWVILFACQLGSATLATLAPVLIRLHYIRKGLIERSQLTFDLRRFRRVPQALVEYKALSLLVKIVLAYHVVIYFFYSMCITIWIYANESNHHHVKEVLGESSKSPSIGTFVAFTVVSAFTNTGFSVTSDSLMSFRQDFFFLFCINMLALHGNVLFPVFIRWIIIGLNGASNKQSSRKVYFRYLLTKGRDLYCHLFTSQQTWLLLIIQIIAITAQGALTLATSYNELGSSDEPRKFETRFNAAFFSAVNTRHAGFSVLDLRNLTSAANMLFIFFMFLAPAPLAAVQKTSEEAQQLEWHLAEMNLDHDDDDAANDNGLRSAPQLPESMYTHSGRLLNIALAQMGTGGASADLSDDLRLTRISDVVVDTRLLLMMKYPSQRIPVRVRIVARMEAVLYQLKLVGQSVVAPSMLRDVLFLFFAIWVIAVLEGRSSLFNDGYCSMDDDSDSYTDETQMFYLIFEVTSAFGNVGLSMGSLKYGGYRQDSFSSDLHRYSLVVILLVEVVGRARALPWSVKVSLSMPSEAQDYMIDLDSDSPSPLFRGEAGAGEGSGQLQGDQSQHEAASRAGSEAAGGAHEAEAPPPDRRGEGRNGIANPLHSPNEANGGGGGGGSSSTPEEASINTSPAMPPDAENENGAAGDDDADPELAAAPAE